MIYRFKLAFLALLAFPLAAGAQVIIFMDDFSYPDGNLVGNGGWAAHSAAGAVPVQVSNGAAVLAQGTGSREDVNKSLGITLAAGESLSATFTLTLSGTASVTTTYFAHFLSGTAVFTCRLYVTAVPAASGLTGNYVLGISNGGSAPDATIAEGLTFGTAYQPSISYNFDTGVSTLTLDGMTASTTTAVAGTGVMAFALRQSTGNTGQMIDDLSVTLTSIPEPATWMLMGFGVLLCGRQFLRRRNA